MALLDTGNRLYDPLTKAPVVILELATIKRDLPQEVWQMAVKIAQGELEAESDVPPYWQDRLRILPFCTIGRGREMMVGFRPEAVVVYQGGREIKHHQVIVGFCRRRLAPDGAFHALIAPELLPE
jgi:stage II sporulation protein GA (sporulation sigma-E factor processing peptidase)